MASPRSGRSSSWSGISGALCRVVLVALSAWLMFGSAGAETILVPQDYSAIQLAIDTAQDGDSVLVSPGVYQESLNYLGKNITVKSTDGPLKTTITNERTVTLVHFDHGETSAAVLDGFTLQGGWIAVLISSSAPTIKRNICRDQNVWNWAAIALAGQVTKITEPGGDPQYVPEYGPAPAIIVNNTIVHSNNGGISTFSTVAPTFKNNIVALNDAYGLHQNDKIDGPNQPQPVLSHNNITGGYFNTADPGTGSMSTDPLFSDGFRLSIVSPCVDAGDPDPAYNDPDGTRNDMGALPLAAGSSVCCTGQVGDVNLDGQDEPTLADIATAIDAVFISGRCAGLVDCLAEADVNHSGGQHPSCVDISIADISTLIDYLFITGTSLGLPDCL